MKKLKKQLSQEWELLRGEKNPEIRTAICSRIAALNTELEDDYHPK